MYKILFFVLFSQLTFAASMESGNELFSSGDYRESLKVYESLAVNGNVEAMKMLVDIYSHKTWGDGLGIEEDRDLAFIWALKGAELGHAELMIYVSGAYDKGLGVPTNKVEAFEWMNKAAETDSNDANYFLYFMFKNGTGTEKDSDKAMEFLQLAAKGGHSLAMRDLAEFKDVCDVEGKEQTVAGVTYHANAVVLAHEPPKFLESISIQGNECLSESNGLVQSTGEAVTLGKNRWGRCVRWLKVVSLDGDCFGKSGWVPTAILSQ